MALRTAGSRVVVVVENETHAMRCLPGSRSRQAAAFCGYQPDASISIPSARSMTRSWCTGSEHEQKSRVIDAVSEYSKAAHDVGEQRPRVTRSMSNATLLRRSPTGACPQARHDPDGAGPVPSKVATGARSRCGDVELVGGMDEQHSITLMEAVRSNCEGVADLDRRIVAQYPTYRVSDAFDHFASDRRGFSGAAYVQCSNAERPDMGLIGNLSTFRILYVTYVPPLLRRQHELHGAYGVAF